MSRPIDRRTTLKWMLSAAATLPVLSLAGCDSEPAAPGEAPSSAEAWAVPKDVTADGYGKDPDLLKDYKPGDTWPLTFDQAQRATATALSALILPADDEGPGAVEVGVVDFIDEWVSAPYAQQRRDRGLVLPGLGWIDAEAKRRYGDGFAALKTEQQRAICDDIRYLPKAKAEHRQAAEFFARYRDLTAGGFCTSPQGRTYLRYVGNTPLPRFDGPPPEVLKRVGLG